MNSVLRIGGSKHPEYQELCALLSGGALTEEEGARLKEHLSECSDCRRYMEQFPAKAAAAMATLAPTYALEASSTKSLDLDTAKRRLFERLPKHSELATGGGLESEVAMHERHVGLFSRLLIFARSFKPYLSHAMGFFLAMGLSLTLYWHGPRKQTEQLRVNADRAQNDATTSRQETTELSKQRDALNARLRERTSAVLALQDQISQLRGRIGELEAADVKTAVEKQELAEAKEGLTKSVQDAQASLQDTQLSLATLSGELDSLRQEHASQSLKAADVEKGTEQLSAALRDRNERIEQRDAIIQEQRDLLAHDRDIRDLMGARQLYVAEVYDSDENGRPKKPYARVFYTKDRSLIFYGFDLDRQPGVRNAAAFQVWGRRGANRENALNLGILFQDSSSNKRWTLKIDDPMKLQQIDAVFVTIEPKGGSAKPTGKPLLFAYLRVDPNHP